MWCRGRDDGDCSSEIEKSFVLLVLLGIAFSGDVICLLQQREGAWSVGETNIEKRKFQCDITQNISFIVFF
jgi:hypothetical protein